jgi:hypothetical protein
MSIWPGQQLNLQQQLKDLQCLENQAKYFIHVVSAHSLNSQLLLITVKYLYIVINMTNKLMSKELESELVNKRTRVGTKSI